MAARPSSLTSISPTKITLLTIVACALTSCSPSPKMNQGSETTAIRVDKKVIYGADDRREIYEETNPILRALASSTVALVDESDLALQTNGDYLIKTANYGTSYSLCPSERFIEQNFAAFCSGFLVAPDIVMTAGHCVANFSECSSTAFVFDFSYLSAGAQPTHALKDNVYKCASIIHSDIDRTTGADYSLIRLDRPVVGRSPVKLRSSGQLQVNDPLVVIGHPSGLPTKIADGARVRDASANGYFVANLDTYGGNSGSPVFNATTYEVEGILVRGETDFKWTPDQCFVSYTCEDDECRGEDVTRIEQASAHLPPQSIP
jgi:V8-like Glu-specific endopeptidase